MPILMFNKGIPSGELVLHYVQEHIDWSGSLRAISIPANTCNESIISQFLVYIGPQ